MVAASSGLSRPDLPQEAHASFRRGVGVALGLTEEMTEREGTEFLGASASRKEELPSSPSAGFLVCSKVS